VPVIAQQSGDPGAVVFDALGAARARGTEVVIADTAGRLPTQLHLMEEIRKVKRVAAKAQAGAPHEVLLVLDANTGQNALAQVKAFDDALASPASSSPSSMAPPKAGGLRGREGAARSASLRRRRRRHRRPAPVRRARFRRGAGWLAFPRSRSAMSAARRR